MLNNKKSVLLRAAFVFNIFSIFLPIVRIDLTYGGSVTRWFYTLGNRQSMVSGLALFLYTIGAIVILFLSSNPNLYKKEFFGITLNEPLTANTLIAYVLLIDAIIFFVILLQFAHSSIQFLLGYYCGLVGIVCLLSTLKKFD